MHGLVRSSAPTTSRPSEAARRDVHRPAAPAHRRRRFLGALRPRSLWTLVILIAALSLVGYIATRALGPQRGTAVTGLSGGLVSSTAVTLAFAKQSRDEGGRPTTRSPGPAPRLAVMGVRIVVLAAILFAALVRPLLLPFGAMTAVTLGAAVLFLRRGRAEARPRRRGRAQETRSV